MCCYSLVSSKVVNNSDNDMFIEIRRAYWRLFCKTEIVLTIVDNRRLKQGLFKPLKKFATCLFDVISLHHQTSDKRQLCMNGEGIKTLAGFKTRSSKPPGLQSERAEVGTKSLLLGSSAPKISCQKFI